ncbi:MAG: hypothetical protein ACXVXE_00405 [Nocardioidaceae bacterium]
MARVAVIGERVLVAGYALGGALVLEAETGPAVRAAWDGLPGDVAVVVLTPGAHRALADRVPADRAPLTVVLPG